MSEQTVDPLITITWNAKDREEFTAWAKAAQAARIVRKQSGGSPFALDMFGSVSNFRQAFPDVGEAYWQEKVEEENEQADAKRIAWYEDDLPKTQKHYDFTEDVPDYGDVMTMEEFRECVESRSFIDYDGIGTPMRDGKCMRFLDGSHTVFSPSELDQIPPEATHICWFNR